MPSRFGLELRSGCAADAAGLAELMRAGGLEPERAGLAERIEALRAEHGAVLVAIEWGPPSGVIALSWRWSLHHASRVAAVSLLLVDPDTRRRGIGRLLIRAAAQAARQAGCGELRLAAAAGATTCVRSRWRRAS